MQFLTDNDFAIANANNDQDQQPDGEQLSLHAQNNAILYHHHDYPRYKDPTDLWNGWEYSPNGSFGYSRIAPRCDVGLPQGSPLTYNSTPMSGRRFTSFIQTPVSISQRPSASLSKSII